MSSQALAAGPQPAAGADGCKINIGGAGLGPSASDAAQQQQPQQQQQQEGELGNAAAVTATSAPVEAAGKDLLAPGSAGGDGGPAADGEDPPLAKELGVSLVSMERLFCGDRKHEFEQPVWMVVNLQGKIKGSYTAEKMMEFCRRGTLSAGQLVLGIDRDLPYCTRQDRGFYRPLGDLVAGVHRGGKFVPLSATGAQGPEEWTPVALPVDDHWSPGAAGGTAPPAGPPAADSCATMDALVRAAGAGPDADESPTSEDGGAAAAAADAALRGALHRLFAPVAGPEGTERQPSWLYINHLGWCRGPFCGSKLLHAHLCGRLPRDTLVVGYDPDMPVFMLSGDVPAWFRPLGPLLDNVACGYSYQPVSWAHLLAHSGAGGSESPGSSGGWQPLLWVGEGGCPPLADCEKLRPESVAASQAGTAAINAALKEGPCQGGTGSSGGGGCLGSVPGGGRSRSGSGSRSRGGKRRSGGGGGGSQQRRQQQQPQHQQHQAQHQQQVQQVAQQQQLLKQQQQQQQQQQRQQQQQQQALPTQLMVAQLRQQSAQPALYHQPPYIILGHDSTSGMASGSACAMSAAGGGAAYTVVQLLPPTGPQVPEWALPDQQLIACHLSHPNLVMHHPQPAMAGAGMTMMMNPHGQLGAQGGPGSLCRGAPEGPLFMPGAAALPGGGAGTLTSMGFMTMAGGAGPAAGGAELSLGGQAALGAGHCMAMPAGPGQASSLTVAADGMRWYCAQQQLQLQPTYQLP